MDRLASFIMFRSPGTGLRVASLRYAFNSMASVLIGLSKTRSHVGCAPIHLHLMRDAVIPHASGCAGIPILMMEDGRHNSPPVLNFLTNCPHQSARANHSVSVVYWVFLYRTRPPTRIASMTSINMSIVLSMAAPFIQTTQFWRDMLPALRTTHLAVSRIKS